MNEVVDGHTIQSSLFIFESIEIGQSYLSFYQVFERQIMNVQFFVDDSFGQRIVGRITAPQNTVLTK